MNVRRAASDGGREPHLVSLLIPVRLSVPGKRNVIEDRLNFFLMLKKGLEFPERLRI